MRCFACVAVNVCGPTYLLVHRIALYCISLQAARGALTPRGTHRVDWMDDEYEEEEEKKLKAEAGAGKAAAAAAAATPPITGFRGMLQKGLAVAKQKTGIGGGAGSGSGSDSGYGHGNYKLRGDGSDPTNAVPLAQLPRTEARAKLVARASERRCSARSGSIVKHHAGSSFTRRSGI